MEHDWIAASKLWLVLDRQVARPRSLREVTRLAVAGGVDTVLCRIKDASPAQTAQLAAEVREACRDSGTPFVMSHFPELALELDADAVQLGVSDPSIAEVRRIVGPSMPIGFSTHGVGEAQRCFAAAAAYVFLGPIFPTPAKLKYGPPLGLDAVRDSTLLPGPVVCIGGINADNAALVLDAGAHRIAAISALQAGPDPQSAARHLALLLASRGAG